MLISNIKSWTETCLEQNERKFKWNAWLMKDST